MTVIEHFVTKAALSGQSGEACPTGAALCRACAQAGTCCCRTDPKLTYMSFPLSDPEWQRLLPYADLADGGKKIAEDGDAIRVVEPNAPDFIASMRSLFPRDKKHIDLLFPQGGIHYTLRTRPDGSCVFLGEKGCRLPRLARPWYCLLFPVWMIEDSLTLFMSEHCLIAQKAHSPAHGAALLEQRPALIREWCRSLRFDWGFAPRNNES